MITLQILNKVLNTKDYSIIRDNGLEEDLFKGYEEEYVFIKDHIERYGNVPDVESLMDKFPDFQPLEVLENDKYLLDTLYEEDLYYRMVQTIKESAELLKSDSNLAVELLTSKLPELQPRAVETGVDIIKKADLRYKTYQDKRTAEKPYYITTGFPELDDIIYGWAKGEELAVLFARTGQGKSWVLGKTLSHAWELGLNVGYISPEMSSTKVGYRIDTLLHNFSNTSLIRGMEVTDYDKYIDDLKTKSNPFIVATPLDFNKRITVSKLRQFCLSNKLNILGIDGITYLTDERYKKGDNKTTSLTNISEDLMSLSIELQIPIIVVVQSNRQGVRDNEDEGTPDLENIRDSDGIAQNATKVIALRQTGAGLEMGIKKHRDGATGGKLIYYWDIDTGKFDYVSGDKEPTVEAKKEKKKEFKDKTDVF